MKTTRLILAILSACVLWISCDLKLSIINENAALMQDQDTRMQMLQEMAKNGYLVKDTEKIDDKGNHMITFYHHPVIDKYKKTFPEGIDKIIVNESDDQITSIEKKDGKLIVNSIQISEPVSFKMKLSFKVTLEGETLKTVYPYGIATYTFAIEKKEYDKIEILSTEYLDISWNEDNSKAVVKYQSKGGDMNFFVTFKNLTDTWRHNLSVRTHTFKQNETEYKLSCNGEVMKIKEAFSGSVPLEDINISVSEDWLSAQILEDGTLQISAGPNKSVYDNTATLTLSTPSEEIRPLRWNISQTCVNDRLDGYVFFECINFKRAVVEKYDTDGDFEISYDEAAQIQNLDVSGKGITLMTGVEYMNGLRSLDFSDNPINKGSVVDLSAPHHGLTNVTCDISRGITVNLTGCAYKVEVKTIGDIKTWYENENINSYICTEMQAVFDAEENRLNIQLQKVPEIYKSTDYSEDGKEITLLSHTKGDGIIILMKSNGFLDCDIASGMVNEIAWMIIEDIFSLEPYKSFREYFDFVLINNIGETRNKPYKAGKDYSRRSEVCATINIRTEQRSDANFNGNVAYVGGVELWLNKGMISHEFAHAFATIGDEYGLYEHLSETASWTPNVSLSNDPEVVQWKRFLKDPDYKDNIGIYQIPEECGLIGYAPTKGSIMGPRCESDYFFNAPCRYKIFENIMIYSHTISCVPSNSKYKSEEELWKMFKEYDAINRPYDYLLIEIN